MSKGNKGSWWGLCLVSLCLLCLGTGSALGQSPTELKKDTEELKEKLHELQEQMQTLQDRLQATEKALQESEQEQNYNTEDIQDLDKRVAHTERHTAADKVELGVELEPRVWSIQMQDVRSSFGVLQDNFSLMGSFPQIIGQEGFTDQQMQAFLQGDMNAFQQSLSPDQQAAFGAWSNANPQQTAHLMGLMSEMQDPPKIDVDNDAIRTLRFRLRMDARVNDNLRFAGRLAAYKVWGDSVGINFNKSGLQDITLDGTSATDPHGDSILLERAYFVYSNEFQNLPWYISVGRRPSTAGIPLQYSKNLPAQGGSPYAHIINWQFDGASLHFDLAEITGIPGFDLKLCYGSGFESQYGTTSAFLDEPNVEDVDLYGIIGTLYEGYIPAADMELSVGYNYAFAPDISDGFTGLTVMPFTVDKSSDGQYMLSPNNDLFVSRVEPTANIGDWQALTLGMQANYGGNWDVYLSGAWSHTKAEKVSENPLYEMLGMSLLSSGGELESHDGYSFFGGTRYTVADWGTKVGLEYNYGSKYWFNFTGAEDNLIGSKLATRGHVLEPYLIQEIVGNRFFLRLGAQFYKFNYSGSGNPLGKPVDVDDVTGMDTIFPVIDEMQQYYASVVFRF